MSNEVTDALRRRVAERAYYVCEYCLVHETTSTTAAKWIM